MKKLISLVLVFLFALTTCAFAVPSKSTADMATVEVAGDNIPADSGFAITPVVDETVNEALVKTVQAEIAKLAESASAVEYFGEVKDAEGNVVSLTELLGVDTVNVFEFMPLSVENYDVAYGNVTATFQFATVYAEGEEVLVLIGVVNEETEAVEWTALNGVGTGAEGAIEVEFTPEVLEAIQGGEAMMAVVSK